MKSIRIFCLKIFLFLVVKFSIYLNRCVFVMIFYHISELMLPKKKKIMIKNYFIFYPGQKQETN